MNFNRHISVDGQHAFLGASKYHWINYDENKIADNYLKFLATQKGTELHNFAAKCIELKQRLPKEPRTTLSMYVNDAIHYMMTPEQILYYSENAFGTADSIVFEDFRPRPKLRIHDLKTGAVPAHIEQLKVYAALFCLEYNYSPFEIDIELRIYQNDERYKFIPDPSDINEIKLKIINFDKIINNIKKKEGI